MVMEFHILPRVKVHIIMGHYGIKGKSGFPRTKLGILIKSYERMTSLVKN